MQRLQAAFTNCFRSTQEGKCGMLPTAVQEAAQGVSAAPAIQPAATQVCTTNTTSFHVHLSPVEEVQVLACLKASGHIVAWEASPPSSYLNRSLSSLIAQGNVGRARPVLPIPSSAPPDCEEGVPWVMRAIHSDMGTLCSGGSNLTPSGLLPSCSYGLPNPNAERGACSPVHPTQLIVLSQPSNINACATGKSQSSSEAPFVVHNKVYQKVFHSLAKECSRLGMDVHNMLQGLSRGECSSCRHLVVHKPGPASHKALLPFTLEVHSCYILLHKIGGAAVTTGGQQQQQPQQPAPEPVRVPCLLVKCPPAPLQEHLTAAELDQIPAMVTVFDCMGRTIKQNCRSQEYIDWLQQAEATRSGSSRRAVQGMAAAAAAPHHKQQHQGRQDQQAQPQGPHGSAASHGGGAARPRPLALDLIFQWDPEELQELKERIAQGQEYEGTVLVPYPTASRGLSLSRGRMFDPAAASQQPSTHKAAMAAAAAKHTVVAAGQEAMASMGCGTYTTVKTGMAPWVQGGGSSGAAASDVLALGMCDLAEPSLAPDLCKDLAMELHLGADLYPNPPDAQPPVLPDAPVSAAAEEEASIPEPASCPAPKAGARASSLPLRTRRSKSLESPALGPKSEASALGPKSEATLGTPVAASPPSVRDRVNALLLKSHNSLKNSRSNVIAASTSDSSSNLAGQGSASAGPSSYAAVADERGCLPQTQPGDCKADVVGQERGVGLSPEGPDGMQPGSQASAATAATASLAAANAGWDPNHRWHRVHAKCYHDMASGMDLMILTQMDVTDQVELQLRLQAVLEHEHRVLEGMFPRHVIEHIAAVGCGVLGAGTGAGLGPGSISHLQPQQSCQQQQQQQGASPHVGQPVQQQQEDAVLLQQARPPPPGLEQPVACHAALTHPSPSPALPAIAGGSPPPKRATAAVQHADAASQVVADGRATVQGQPGWAKGSGSSSGGVMEEHQHMLPIRHRPSLFERPQQPLQQQPLPVLLSAADATASKDYLYFSAPPPGMLGDPRGSGPQPPSTHGGYHAQHSSLHSAPSAVLGKPLIMIPHRHQIAALATSARPSKASRGGYRSLRDISLSEPIAELTSLGGPMMLLDGAARTMHEESGASATVAAAAGHGAASVPPSEARATSGAPAAAPGLAGAAYSLNALSTSHPLVTIMFADIAGFTAMCDKVPAHTVMAFLNHLYHLLDQLLDKHGVYKVETIGDCYMVAGGLLQQDTDGYMAVVQEPRPAEQARQVMDFAKAALAAAAELRMPHDSSPVRLRVGLHTGPVISGIVGCKMPRFCLFGDTVNTASRCESTGVPGHIHVSAVTRQLLGEGSEVWQQEQVQAKGKGTMTTFLWPANQQG